MIKRLRAFFCGHKKFGFVINVVGGNKNRSWWKCINCGKLESRGYWYHGPRKYSKK